MYVFVSPECFELFWVHGDCFWGGGEREAPSYDVQLRKTAPT